MALALRNFHLPLPEDVYRALREEAEATKQPATAIAREAIEAWLRDRRRSALRETIAAYPAEHAGTAVDLDPVLEAAGLNALRPIRRRRRRA